VKYIFYGGEVLKRKNRDVLMEKCSVVIIPRNELNRVGYSNE